MPRKKQDVTKSINDKFGAGTLMSLGAPKKIDGLEVIPTELASLDIATGVMGIPKGVQIEIFGPESLGKTATCAHIAGKFLKYTNKKVFIIDAEHSIDPTFFATFGVDVYGEHKNRVFISQPDTGEQALEVTQMLIKSQEFAYGFIDSTASLVPKRELEGDLGDSTMAERARLLSKACPQFAAQCKKMLTTLMWINQIRMKIGVRFGDPTTTPGGNALKFYSHMRMRLGLPQDNKLKRGDAVIGRRTRVTMVKNKCGVPFREAIIEHKFGDGFQEEKSLVMEGLARKVLKKRESPRIKKDCIYYGKKNLGIHDKYLTKLDNEKIDKYRESIMEEIYEKVQ